MDTVLELSPALAATIICHAEEEWPYEACGVAIGKPGQPPLFHIPMANCHPDPANGFAFTHTDTTDLWHNCDRLGLAPTVIYHSHPTTPAYPSPTDTTQAAGSDIFHLIISLTDRDHPILRAYRITDGRVTPQPLTT